MKPPTDKNRVARTAAKQRATGRAQARTRSQISRPGKIAESGTLGYSLAKLAGSLIGRAAPAAAKATVKKAPSMAQKAARGQITITPAKGPGSRAVQGKYPANPTSAQKGSLTKYANKKAAATAAKKANSSSPSLTSGTKQGARIAAGAGAAAGIGATIALGRRDNGKKPVPANEYQAKKPIKISYSSGKAPVRKKG